MKHRFTTASMLPALFTVVLAVVANAQTTQPAVDPQLLSELKKIDAEVAQVQDLTADFEQKKFSPLLKKPIVSRGTVIARGAATLWLTQKPEPTRMRIDSTSMQIYYPSRKQIEVYPLKGKLAAMAASPLPRLATLVDQFTIRREMENSIDDSIHLLLTPRDAELAQYVKHVRVTIYFQPQHVPQVVEFEMTDPDGERTTISFYHQKTNQNLAANALDLDAPPGTETVQPLGPVGK